MSEEPRAYTEDEIREQFLEQSVVLSRYWATVKMDRKFETPAAEVLARCEGVVFSMLAMIDGSSLALPAFMLIPAPHPDDKDFHISEDENYYPEPPEGIEGACDIAGTLHELLHTMK